MTFPIGSQKMRYGVGSEKGIYRQHNEDIALIVTDFIRDYPQVCVENGITKNPFVLFAIFDGHGGARAARFAGQHLPSFLLSRWRHEKNLAVCLRLALIDVETNFLHQGQDDGTTALVLLITPEGKCYIANIGDCEGMIIYQPLKISDRHLRPLIRKEPLYPTNPHNLSKSPEEICRITADGGEIIDNRLCLRFPNGDIYNLLAVSRAIGDRLFKKRTPLIVFPDICERRFTGYEEIILLACDGLWDALNIDDVFQILTVCKEKKLSLSEMVQVLTNIAYQRGSQDNITIIIISPISTENGS